MRSALFWGDVVHARHRPRKHALSYKVLSFLLDLDELQDLDRRLKLFGVNRRAAFRFDESDHGTGDDGAGDPGALKRWVLGHVAKAGLDTEDLRVRVLCYPRLFGYAFNPLSVYFCERPDGRTVAILYEVCNTFKERHTYVIPVPAEGEERTVRHRCAKEMYVSPFIPMECEYRFRVLPPEDDVLIAIDEHDAEGSLLYASFAGRRQEMTDKALLAAILRYPLMTFKVIAAIHWEAFRLWAKGIPIQRHNKAASPVASSIITSPTTGSGRKIR